MFKMDDIDDLDYSSENSEDDPDWTPPLNIIEIQEEDEAFQQIAELEALVEDQEEMIKNKNIELARLRKVVLKVAELIKEFVSVKSESFSRLSPKMKDAIKDMLGLVETDKSKENLLIKFNKAIDSVCEKYNVQKFEIEDFIDKVTSENMEK